MTTTPDRLCTLITAHLCCEDRFAWDASWAELGADSLDALELAIAAEVEFGVLIADAVVDSWRTPGDMLATVQGLVTVEPADHFAGAGKMVGDDEIGGAIDG
jgi:acyl carrier protein